MKTSNSGSGPGATTDLQPTRRVQPGLVLMIGALSAMAPFSISMYLPGLPALVKDLDIATSTGQLTLTACMFGLGIGQVISGPLSDALGRRRPLLAGLLAFTLASLLCALAPSAPIFIALRFLQGLFGAVSTVVALATVRDLFVGAEMARFLALTSVVTGAAPILAPVAGGQLLALASWRGIFGFLAALVAVLTLLSAFVMRETLPRERRVRPGGILLVFRTFYRLLRDRRFLGYVLSSGLALGALLAYVSASPFVLQQVHGMSPQLFSLIFGFNAVGGICAGQLSAVLVKNVPPRRLLAVGLAIMLAGGVLLLISTIASLGLAGILAGFFLVGTAPGFITPNASTLALADHQHDAGSAAGLIGMLGQVMGGIVAPLVGIAGPTTAVPMAIVIFVLSVGACCAFILLAAGAATPKSATAHLAAAGNDLQSVCGVSGGVAEEVKL